MCHVWFAGRMRLVEPRLARSSARTFSTSGHWYATLESVIQLMLLQKRYKCKREGISKDSRGNFIPQLSKGKKKEEKAKTRSKPKRKSLLTPTPQRHNCAKLLHRSTIMQSFSCWLYQLPRHGSPTVVDQLDQPLHGRQRPSLVHS